MRYISTAIVYLFVLWLVGTASIFWILGIVGPEVEYKASETVQIVSYVACAIAILALPLWAAISHWKRTKPERVA